MTKFVPNFVSRYLLNILILYIKKILKTNIKSIVNGLSIIAYLNGNDKDISNP